MTTRYQSLDQRSHILHRPDMYIGTVVGTQQEVFVASPAEEDSVRIVKRPALINPGLHRIFIEILSNAIDNVWRSASTDTKTTRIKVDITPEGEITVWNDGLTIPVEIDAATGLYNPELVFGRLLTSSNYDDQEERMTSGRNGLGAKATSVFSAMFNVKLFDPTTGKQYVQTWRNNMADREKAKITSPKQKTGYTQITFLPDYARFGVAGLSPEMRALFHKNIIDTAMITGVVVYFNDTRVPVKTLRDYADLYSPPIAKADERKVDDDTLSVSSGSSGSSGVVGKERAEMIALSTADSDVVLASKPVQDGLGFEVISFVNGIETFQGGVHVDAWSEALLRPVLEKINAGVKKGSSPLVMKDIRPYFRLFLNCKLPNPAFSSQEKSKLVSPSVQPVVPARTLTAVMKWGVIEAIQDILKSRELLALKKTEKKKGFVKIDGLDPANLAGGRQAGECSLVLCEGDSAKTFAVKGIQTGVYGKKGRDYFGIYPLKGKCLNVRNSNTTAISKNREICDVIQSLNLKYGADYSIEENCQSLAYGRVIILTDSDVDGYHICGLLLNFFHSLFPTLLRRNPSFLTCMRTPIVRLYAGKTDLSFYTLEDFRKYQAAHPDRKGEVKYFKGLGTNNNREIDTSFGKKMIEFEMDAKTDAEINKVFHSKFSDQRKTWLEQYDPASDREIVSPEAVQHLSISDFLNYEMIKFSIDDCKRSIPHLIDGLKESHRKILYATFLKNLRHSGKTMKVAQLAGFVAEKTNYHHGEQCLFDTITKLAHDFMGSNNIPLLYRDGQFGSRIAGGKDAANARYIFTKLDALTRLLFRQEDDVLLTHCLDDGEKVEPVFFAPILPTILINGCTAGIGTGWSSQVPCYNPLDLAKAVRGWLAERDAPSGKFEFEEIHPWYRGFRGTIEKTGPSRYVTKGIISKKKGKSNVCVVTELPVGLWTDRFKESVEDLVEAKSIRSYRNYSTDTEINFELDESKDGMECTLENIKLTTTLSTNNMVLFSERGTITRYANVGEILESFCQVRYRYYVERKAHLLADARRRLSVLRNKMRFLREVMSGELVVQERDEEELRKELEQRSYDRDESVSEGGLTAYGYLVNMGIRSFTRQKVEGLAREIAEIEAFVAKTEATTPSAMWRSDLAEWEEAYVALFRR